MKKRRSNKHYKNTTEIILILENNESKHIQHVGIDQSLSIPENLKYECYDKYRHKNQQSHTGILFKQNNKK